MNARFEIEQTPIDGVLELLRKPLFDQRGFLERLYCDADLESVLGDRTIRQINRTSTEGRGIVRGMHFQTGDSAETKVVTCTAGKIFDIAVDLRRNSPTFLKWHGCVLDGDDHRSMLIPEGCAHGFQALTERVEIIYLHTAPYDSSREGGINPLDPAIAVDWPLEPAGMSERDLNHPPIASDFEGI